MKFRRTTGILLVICLLLSVILAPSAFNASASTSYAQNYLNKQMIAKDISGVVYVTHNDRIICQSARGMANTEESKEMTIDTLFPIGSNSKQICAIAVLILRDQGKLSLDEPVTDYFPEFTRAEGMTIRHLLSMRSGIRDYVNDGFSDGDYTLSEDYTREEIHQIVLDWIYESPLLYKPDKGQGYSNSNYFLLSKIVEQASGQKYWDFIKENILIPLDMSNTGPYEELMNHPELAENTYDEGITIDPKYKGLSQGAGDIVSNAKDMTKLYRSYREYTILSKETIKEMTTPYSKGFNYGYGLIANEGGQLCHNGAADTYISVSIIYPKDGFSVFAVTNDRDKNGDSIEELAFDIANRFHAKNIYGDVNLDNDVNIKDATMIQKASAEIITLSEYEASIADVNTDKDVNIKDATAIQKHTAEIETDLPVGNIIE